MDTRHSDALRYAVWEIDVAALTIVRLVCDGPDRADCLPVFG